jgi:cytidylate kinase
MAIITVSRGTFSGGTSLAECLAGRLGYDIISREVLAEAAVRYGASEAKLAEALEKSPGFWDRFLHDRRRYLAFVQAALAERVSRDNVVYHGHAGQLLLKGVRHVLRVRLIAPIEYRVSQVMTRLGQSREAALSHIDRVDREREQWTRFLYGVDWRDPSLYDMTLSLEHAGLDSACEAIVAMARRPEFQADEASTKAMADLLLASRVRAALARDEATAHAEVNVRADAGVLEIEGRLTDPVLVDDVIGKAGEVSGVTGVKYGTRTMFRAARQTPGS